MNAVHDKRRTGSQAGRAVAASASSRRKPVPGAPVKSAPKGVSGSHWTFLTNHAHVLILLDRNPAIVLRQVALEVGITERAAQRIVADLQAAGIIECTRVGRQNHYRILADKPLRHPIECHRTIDDLLAVIRTPEC